LSTQNFGKRIQMTAKLIQNEHQNILVMSKLPAPKLDVHAVTLFHVEGWKITF